MYHAFTYILVQHWFEHENARLVLDTLYKSYIISGSKAYDLVIQNPKFTCFKYVLFDYFPIINKLLGAMIVKIMQ